MTLRSDCLLTIQKALFAAIRLQIQVSSEKESVFLIGMQEISQFESAL